MKLNIKYISSYVICLFSCLGLASCGGGGGGGGGGAESGEAITVDAAVTRNSCDERLSAVKQPFTLNGEFLDTSLAVFEMSSVGGNLVGGFSESNGDCTRTYEVTLNDESFDSITLLSQTACPTVSCETEWQGGGTAKSAALESVATNERVRGEACNPTVPLEVGYRPSLFECNGNAAVLLRGALRNNYSVVLRRNGQFNDRDPNNPSCETNRCSPFKTQKRMELADYQVNCLGASGYSSELAEANRISIKFTAQVTNPNDISQFEQWCLTSVQTAIN